MLSVDFRQQAPRQSRIRPIVFPAFAIVLRGGRGGGAFCAHAGGPTATCRTAIAQGRHCGRLRELTEVVKVRPNYVPAWMLLGSAYLRTQQD